MLSADPRGIIPAYIVNKALSAGKVQLKFEDVPVELKHLQRSKKYRGDVVWSSRALESRVELALRITLGIYERAMHPYGVSSAACVRTRFSRRAALAGAEGCLRAGWRRTHPPAHARAVRARSGRAASRCRNGHEDAS